MTESTVHEKTSTRDWAIEAVSLEKKYKKAKGKALDSFTLRLKKGEFYGLLGPNGAGKTTALSILSGLFPPDSGSVTLLGEDPVKQGQSIKKLFGLVPQDIALYEQLTVLENIILFGRLYGLSGKNLTQQVQRYLAFSQLSDHAGQLVSVCSGGMKRRLNLAIGLLHDPPLLFLDEPTVGIDAQSRNHLQQQLRALNKEGTTILYTTHYMEEAKELCSRIGIIDGGKIITEGKPETLLEQHRCKNLEQLFLQLTGRQLRDS